MALLEHLGATLQRWEREPLLKFIPPLKKLLPHAQLYLVGGSVRDALLGQAQGKDFDIVIRGVVPSELEQALSQLGTVDLVGKIFGVFKFCPRGVRSKEAVDIALPRTEHALGTGGYREVDVQSNPQLLIEEDLERRDFTINAMAVELGEERLRTSRLIDPFGGFEDLQRRQLRCVGLPTQRFQEDYSRMLRAIRFACQLHCTIEPTTWAGIQQLMPHINDPRDSYAAPEDSNRVVPSETIAKEFLKSFWFDPVRALDLYDDSGAINELIPELLRMKGCPHPHEYHSEGDVWTHTRLALGQLSTPQFLEEFPDDPITMETIIGVLFHDIGKPTALMPPVEAGTDRYRYHGHDKMGSELVGVIANRLKLSSQSKESNLHISIEHIQWIIQKHLLLLNSKIEEMRASTIERYFFNPRLPGITLLQVILADSLATVPLNAPPILKHFREMKHRIEELLRTTGQSTNSRSRSLPSALVGGGAIMEMFNLAPGPKIGKLLRILREEQLEGLLKTKEEAFARIRAELHSEKNKSVNPRPRNLTLNV